LYIYSAAVALAVVAVLKAVAVVEIHALISAY